jgi:LPS sulfotransferase NodH
MHSRLDRSNKFVVLTSQRSGSTWLIDVLNNVKSITAYGELFLPRLRDWASGAPDYPQFIEWKPNRLRVRPFSVFAYLDELYNQPGAVGFKLMYSHLRAYPEIWGYICRHRIRVMHLVRPNHLDVIISLKQMRGRQQAHFLPGQETKGSQVYIDPSNLLQQMKKKRGYIGLARKLLRWCGLPHIEVNYQDLLTGNGFDPVWEFLSIAPPREVPSSRLVKTRTASQAEVISNYEEVKRILTGTVFQELLE